MLEDEQNPEFPLLHVKVDSFPEGFVSEGGEKRRLAGVRRYWFSLSHPGVPSAGGSPDVSPALLRVSSRFSSDSAQAPRARRGPDLHA